MSAFHLLLLASVHAATKPARTEALMNEIERRVVLPEGADALRVYDRGYALANPDKVVGIYLMSPRTGTGQMRAGKRKWYGRIADLPFVFDGGCMQVRVEYQISTHRVLSASCNGYA
jgi:hypothetical protein